MPPSELQINCKPTLSQPIVGADHKELACHSRVTPRNNGPSRLLGSMLLLHRVTKDVAIAALQEQGSAHAVRAPEGGRPFCRQFWSFRLQTGRVTPRRFISR